MPVDKYEAYWYSCYTALVTKVEQAVKEIEAGSISPEEALRQINEHLHPSE